MKKQLRVGKVLVDWSQNDEHKTTISVYSLRARERPTVSTPVTWEEVEQALAKKDAKLLVFEANQVLKRVEKMGDLFEPILKLKQKLPKLPGIEDATPQAIEAGLEMSAQASEKRVKATPARKSRTANVPVAQAGKKAAGVSKKKARKR
jgi:bifunctional non-homologous end joining protein LigD